MSLVGLTLMNDEDVYINPAQVNCLKKPEGAGHETTTEIVFGPSDQVIVKGDIDSIAFQLFPNGVR
jgi:Fe-S cluster assembly ATPase SufC